ncbi:MAG: peptide deformylase [Clostridia bacterium]|nr:peptide deformylase [Clostridia bacterium]
MAIRTIIKSGDEVLKRVCRTQLTFDERLASLLDDMADTMYAADGCGLAASQVGILRRICVVDVGDGLIELVNPVIIEKKGVQEEQEGCLSFPGEYGTTVRPMKVKVRAQDRNGNTFTVEGEGLKARAFCHEIDHLDGIVFKDRLK